MFEYERVMVVVVTENEKELKKYFRLFKFMLIDEEGIRISESKDYCTIEKSNLHMRFIIKKPSVRGMKAHYVLNLTQDQEFQDNSLFPITTIHNLLKDDPKWKMLFT